MGQGVKSASQPNEVRAKERAAMRARNAAAGPKSRRDYSVSVLCENPFRRWRAAESGCLNYRSPRGASSDRPVIWSPRLSYLSHAFWKTAALRCSIARWKKNKKKYLEDWREPKFARRCHSGLDKPWHWTRLDMGRAASSRRSALRGRRCGRRGEDYRSVRCAPNRLTSLRPLAAHAHGAGGAGVGAAARCARGAGAGSRALDTTYSPLVAIVIPCNAFNGMEERSGCLIIHGGAL